MVYYANFKSISNTEYEVNIVTSGSSTRKEILLAGKDPVVIESSSDLFDTFRTQSCKVNIVTDEILSDLYSAGMSDILLEVYDANRYCLFSGYVVPCAYSQNWVSLDKLTIEAVSRDTVLQYKDFDLSNGSIYSFHDILKRAFIDICHFDSIYVHDCYGMQPNERLSNYLELLKIQTANFFEDDDDKTPMKWDEVIEEILKFLNLSMVVNGKTVWLIDYSAKAHTTNSRYVIVEGIGKGNKESDATFQLQKSSLSGNKIKISLDEVYNKQTVECSAYPIEEIKVGEWKDVIDKIPLDKNEWTEDNYIYFGTGGTYSKNGTMYTYEKKKLKEKKDYIIEGIYLRSKYGEYGFMSEDNVYKFTQYEVKGDYINKKDYKYLIALRTPFSNHSRKEIESRCNCTMTNAVLSGPTGGWISDGAKEFDFTNENQIGFQYTSDNEYLFTDTKNDNYFVLSGSVIYDIIPDWKIYDSFTGEDDSYQNHNGLGNAVGEYRFKRPNAIYQYGNPNEPYGYRSFRYKLRVGNKYYKAGYYATGTQTVGSIYAPENRQYKIWVNDPQWVTSDPGWQWMSVGGNQDVTWFSDMDFTNTVTTDMKLDDAEGYAIKIPKGTELKGKVTLTIGLYTDLPGWSYINIDSKPYTNKYKYNGVTYYPEYCMLKDLELNFCSTINTTGEKYEDDVEYSNIINLANVLESDSIELKVNSRVNGKKMSFSNVITGTNNDKYVDKLFCAGANKYQLQEYNIIETRVNHYQKPRYKIELDLSDTCSCEDPNTDFNTTGIQNILKVPIEHKMVVTSCKHDLLHDKESVTLCEV